MAHKLMVVDDSVMMRTVIKNMFKKTPIPGVEIVEFAENGKDALKKLENHPDLALILLDIEMPEMDGLEFLRHARLKSKAKVVILSSVALSGSTYANRARELGAAAIVTKPSGAVSYDLAEKKGDELMRTIKTVLRIN